MQWFRNLKVSARLFIMLCIGMFFFCVLGFAGYHYLSQAAVAMDIMYTQDLQSVMVLNEMRTHARAIEADLMALMLTTDDNEKKRLFNDIAERVEKSNKDYTICEKTLLDSSEQEELSKLKAGAQKFRDARKPVLDLIMENKKAEAYQLYINNGIGQLNDAYQQRLIQLTAYNEKKAAERNSANQAAFKSAVLVFIGIIVINLVLTGPLGLTMIRRINRELSGAIAHLEILARGDFSYDVPPEFLMLHDEFGTLAKSVDMMQKNIRSVIQQLSQTVEQLAASSEELTAGAEQSAQAANQVAESISSVANGAAEQLAAADETSAIVEQMSAGVQQVAATTDQVAAQSAQAAEKAQAGGKTVEKAVSQMVNIEDTVNTSAAVVVKLGERSQEIGQIVDTISGIAGQTNLLALNAAIEAARAGEQGRGFAVVAEEVRKLAEQSQEAAKKIAELIGEIQGDTEKAVAAMNNGTREVKTGTEAVNAAGIAFREIVELVAQVSSQVREISAAIQQMASGSQQIVNAVKKIDNLSKASADEAQTVSAATEEQLASMEEIASSSEALSSLAQELQAAVAKFSI